MKSMVKDIFFTTVFSLPFALVFALGGIQILKALKNDGLKKSISKFLSYIKNNKSFFMNYCFLFTPL